MFRSAQEKRKQLHCVMEKKKNKPRDFEAGALLITGVSVSTIHGTGPGQRLLFDFSRSVKALPWLRARRETPDYFAPTEGRSHHRRNKPENACELRPDGNPESSDTRHCP